MIETPHNLLQKTTPLYTDPANSQMEKEINSSVCDGLKAAHTSGDLKYRLE